MKQILQNKKYDELKKLFSIIVTIGFAIYNFFIGIVYSTNWNLIISIYYFLLLCVKFLLVIFIFKLKDKTKENIKKERIVYCVSFALLILINLALIDPALLLIENKKEVHVDETTSILIATYAFINIVVSLINLRKNEDNLLKKQLNIVAFINAIVSMMVLQNTLINIYGSLEGDMYILSLVTNFVFIIILICLTIISFIKNINHFTSDSNLIK